MNRPRVPYRRVLLPVVLALILAAESIAVASSVFARSAATDTAAPVSAPFADQATRPGVRSGSEAATVQALNPWLSPIAEPADPVHVPARPTTAAINKVKSESKATSKGGSGGSGGGSSSASYRGKNRMWFPALGINRPVYFYACSNKSYPGNVVYRWGCAGSNNVYLFAHAHSAFRPLHDAYVNGRLRKGMKVSYADAKGKVRTYKLIWWKVTTPTKGGFAFASQSRPSLTLQTCVGAKSQYRLIVRFVQI
jgi:sortase (surface protein transpeptidase)